MMSPRCRGVGDRPVRCSGRMSRTSRVGSPQQPDRAVAGPGAGGVEATEQHGQHREHARASDGRHGTRAAGIIPTGDWDAAVRAAWRSVGWTRAAAGGRRSDLVAGWAGQQPVPQNVPDFLDQIYLGFLRRGIIVPSVNAGIRAGIDVRIASREQMNDGCGTGGVAWTSAMTGSRRRTGLAAVATPPGTPVDVGSGRTAVRLEVRRAGSGSAAADHRRRGPRGGGGGLRPPDRVTGPAADAVRRARTQGGSAGRGMLRREVGRGRGSDLCARWRGSIRMMPRARRSRPSWPMCAGGRRRWRAPASRPLRRPDLEVLQGQAAVALDAVAQPGRMFVAHFPATGAGRPPDGGAGAPAVAQGLVEVAGEDAGPDG